MITQVVNAYLTGGTAAITSTRWRIYCTATKIAGSWLSIAEIEMRATIGGADQCSGGTASASASGGGTSAANGFDNNTGNQWQSGTGTMPQWIEYTFASAVSVAEVMIRSTSSAGDAPSSFQIQYYDGSSWIAAKTVTGMDWLASHSKAIPVGTVDASTAAYNWRIQINAVQNTGSFPTIREIEMRATSGGADQCSGGGAFADNTSVGNSAAGAFDNDTTTSKWQAVNGTLPNHIGYNFASTVAVTEVTIRSWSTANDSPTNIDIQYYDSEQWQTLWSVSSTGSWSANETKTFTKP